MKQRSGVFASASEQRLDEPFERPCLTLSIHVSRQRRPSFYFLLFVLLLQFSFLLPFVHKVIQEMLQIYELVPLQPLKNTGNVPIFQFRVMFVTVLHEIFVTEQLLLHHSLH